MATAPTPERTPLDAVRDGIALWLIGAAWLTAVPVGLYFHLRDPDPHAALVGGAILGLASACGLAIRRGHGRAARRVLAIGLLFGTMARAAVLGGVDTVDFGVVAFVPILAAVLASGRTAVLLAAVGAVGAIACMGLEERGLLLDPVRVPSLRNALILQVAMMLTGAFVGWRLALGLGEAFERSRASEEALRRSERRHALAAAGANLGVWEWNLQSGQLWLGSGVQAILGLPPEEREVGWEEWRSLIHPDDRDSAHLASLPAQRGSAEDFVVEYRIRHADGRYLWVQTRGRFAATEHGRALLGSFADVDDLRRAQATLEHRALHDALTGLPNRTLLLDRLTRVLRRAERTGDADWAVLYIDLDRFKEVNDSLGHGAGDALLDVVAARLRTALRSTDTAARLGGDEFVVLLDGVVEPERVAERIAAELQRPVVVEGTELLVRASVGLVVGRAGYDDAEEVLADGDAAMYVAKRGDGARVTVFRGDLRRNARRLVEFDTRLRRALEHREFVPWFQPIVDLETRRVTGWESLVRWQQPDGTIELPDTFLPRAEEIGLLADIDRALVVEACAQVADWTVVGAAQTLSVNLSPRQFARPDLVPWLAKVLQRTGLDPTRLQLEITERLLVDDRGATRARMEDLRALGLRIAVDDFGTGYSSLSYLQSFPIDVLKIDRAFVQEGPNRLPGPLCRAIVSMGAALGLDLVAEGVETEAQRDALLALGCRRGQGFLFGRAEGTRKPGQMAG